MKHRFAAFALCLACVCSIAAQDAKPRLAIKTFDNPASYQKSTIGNALTDILTTELGKTGKYRIIERDAVQELLKEIDFGSGDFAKKQTFAPKGQLTGAEYIMLGKVTNFGYKETAAQEQVIVRGVATMQTIYQQQADVRVDFRVVSVRSGEAVLTESGSARQTNTSATSWLATWNRLLTSSFTTSEFSGSLVGRATLAAIRDVTRKLTDLSSELGTYTSTASLSAGLEQLGDIQGKVLAAVGPDQFVVGVGSGNGIVKGDRLRVFTEVLTKDSKGQVIYREQKDVGNLEVIDVSMIDRAKARLLSSSTPPHEGDTVRVDIDYARALRGVAGGARTGTSTPNAPNANAAALEDLRKRGDRYWEDEHYAQALEQYQKALALAPRDPALLGRVASSQFILKDFLAAEATGEQLLDLGEPLNFTVAHNHSLGYCMGPLAIRKGRLSYAPQTGDDGFSVAARDIVAIEQQGLSGGGQPSIIIRIKNAQGKEQKHTFLNTTFFVKVRSQPFTTPNAFASFGTNTADEVAAAVADTRKLDKIILQLISSYVK